MSSFRGKTCDQEAGTSTSQASDSANDPAGTSVGEECSCELEVENLKIRLATFAPVPGSVHSSYLPYAVQYHCRNGQCAQTSKVWAIHLHQVESQQTCPKFQVSIYHDVEKPYHLLEVTPPVRHWLTARLGYSSGLLANATPTLGQMIKSRSGIYTRAKAKWPHLNSRDIAVLTLALDTIGASTSATEDGMTLEEPVWRNFMSSCREWESSNSGKKNFDFREAERRRVARQRERASCNAELQEAWPPSTIHW